MSNTSGKILDTGEALKAETITGAQMKAAGIDAGGDQVAPDQQVVVTHFSPVKKGQSMRLRLSETYTAPQSYRVEGDEFVFERSLGRPRNSVVLPRGWYLTALSIPAVVRQTPDGLTRVDFVNGPSGFGGCADERAALKGCATRDRRWQAVTPVLAGKTCRETPVEPRDGRLARAWLLHDERAHHPGWIVQ